MRAEKADVVVTWGNRQVQHAGVAANKTITIVVEGVQ